jgi:hypothetical protein
LPAIWQKNDDFVKLGIAAQAETAKLAQVAAARDTEALKGADPGNWQSMQGLS